MMINWFVLSVLVFGLAMPVPPQAQRTAAGAVIQVNTLADEMQVNGNCTLREALQAANHNQPVDGCAAGAGVDSIQIPAGTYTLTIEGPYENDNQTGDIDILESVTITGAGTDKTIIDGGGTDRVFDIPSTEPNVTFFDLTIQNGVVGMTTPPDGADHPVGNGGGIRFVGWDNTLHVERVRFYNNMVEEPVRGHGAGIYSSGWLEVIDSEFTENWAAYDGGAISASQGLLVRHSYFNNNYGYGSADIQFNAPGGIGRIENSDFAFGHCGPTDGGVISLQGGGDLELVDSVVEYADCEAETVQSFGNLTVINTRFRDNRATQGIINHHSGKLVLARGDFSFNRADAMITVTGGEAVIERSAFVKNSGAGLLVQGGIVKLTNSTISTAEGGGVIVENGSLRLESVTLANIQHDFGALQVSGGSVIVHNSLLGYNRELSGEAHDCTLAPGSTVSAGYNLVSTGDACGWQSATGDQIGTRASPINPRLGVLGYSDLASTLTQPPLTGSPAIDRGDPLLYPATDQRSMARPQGPRCDIGAHEVEAAQTGTKFIFLPALRH